MKPFLSIVQFVDYPIISSTYLEIGVVIVNLMKQPKFSHITTLNPQILMGCESNHDLKKWVLTSELIVPDGVGIQWAIKHLYRKQISCITGIQLVLTLLNQGGFSCLLIGATPNSYTKAMEQVKTQFPNVTFLEGSHGYIPESEWSNLIQSIKKQRPDLILVGMGFPKQEQFLQQIQKYCTQGIGIGIGGVIDIFSGYQKWAPKWIRALKLEWLYRGVTQPRRLKTWKFMMPFIYWIIKRKDLDAV